MKFHRGCLRKSYIFFLILTLWASWGGADWFHGVYFDEFIKLLVVLVFICFVTFAKFPLRVWLFWVAGLTLFISAVVLLSSFIFSRNFNVPMWPSLLAQRDYVFFLIAPLVVMSNKFGVKSDELVKVFVGVSFLSMMQFFFLHFWGNLEDLHLSNNPYLSSLVTFDLNRGFRPQIWLVPIFILMFKLSIDLFKKKMQIVNIVFVVASLYMLYLQYSRAITVSYVISFVVLSALFIKRIEIKFAVVSFGLLFVVLAALVLVESDLGLVYTNDWSYIARVEGFHVLIDYLYKYPFGVGVASYHTKSYQDVAGSIFYPSDYGLGGIAFSYGLLVAVLYVVFSLWVFISLVKLKNIICSFRQEVRVFRFVLLVSSLAAVFVMPLQAIFLYNGSGFAAFVVGFIFCLRKEYATHVRDAVNFTTTDYIILKSD